MKVAFRESFLRDVRAIKEKSVQRRIRELIPNLKKLKGHGRYYRIRIGEHRVGLKIEADTVIFVRVLNRKDIYKYFP